MPIFLLFLVVALATALTEQPGSSETHWSYDRTSAIGPYFWGTMSSDFNGSITFPNCRSSMAPQGPIQFLQVAVDESLQRLDFSGYDAPGATVRVTNDGRMLRLVPGGSVASVTYAGIAWDLAIAEIHTPAEHSFGGSVYDMEIHLVHTTKSSASSWLIVVVPFVAVAFGTHTALSDLFTAAIAPTANVSVSTSVSLRWSTLLPSHASYFTYSGTWSYPPCTPARYVVFSQPMMMSAVQLDTIVSSVLGTGMAPSSNARPFFAATEQHEVRKFVDGPQARCQQDAVESDTHLGTSKQFLGVPIAAIVLAGFCVMGFGAVLALGHPPEPIAQS